MGWIFLALLLTCCALPGCIIGQEEILPSEKHFNYTVLFCNNSTNCLDELLAEISKTKYEVRCALYTLDKRVVEALEAKKKKENVEVGLITHQQLGSPLAAQRKTSRSGLMHNKFCVFDKARVWSGSYNPTNPPSRQSQDDVLLINSTLLAHNYLQEFEELVTPKEHRQTAQPRMMLNTTLVENYFCPEDHCITRLQHYLSQAQHSIVFATYSFTHPAISNELILAKSRGVHLQGAINKGGGGGYSQRPTLEEQNIPVKEVRLHHKFFVLDNKTVITGSFNPTRNGNERNDENILVIHSTSVAAAYLEQFQRLFNDAPDN